MIRQAAVGVSQIYLIENKLTGGLLLLALAVQSPQLALFGLLGGMLGTMAGKVLKVPKPELDQGLYGFNSSLCAMAAYVFSTHPFLLAAPAALLGAALMHAFRRFEVPAYTAPFVLVAWGIVALSPTTVTIHEYEWGGLASMLRGTVAGFGQVIFLESLLSGCICLVAVAWGGGSGFRMALYSSVIVTMITTCFGFSHHVAAGLMSYNSVLAAIAVSQLTKGVSLPVLAGVIAALMLVIALGFGIPPFTAPFVLTAWIFRFGISRSNRAGSRLK